MTVFSQVKSLLSWAMKQFILIGRRVKYFLRNIKKKITNLSSDVGYLCSVSFFSPLQDQKPQCWQFKHVCVSGDSSPVLDMALSIDMGALGNGWLACHRGQLLTGRPRSPSVQHTVGKLPALRLLCFGTLLSKVKLPEHTSWDAIAGRQVTETPSDGVVFGVCPHQTKGWFFTSDGAEQKTVIYSCYLEARSLNYYLILVFSS